MTAISRQVDGIRFLVELREKVTGGGEGVAVQEDETDGFDSLAETYLSVYGRR